MNKAQQVLILFRWERHPGRDEAYRGLDAAPTGDSSCSKKEWQAMRGFVKRHLVNAQRRRLLRFALIGVAAACIPACQKGEPNGHGKNTAPDNETQTRHARFPLSNFPPQAGERANESLREFHARELAQGDRFPDVALPSLDGHMASFAADPNIALVVNFWATWYEPCRREMPSLEKLSTFFYPKDFRVVGITVDSDRNLAREFSLRYKLTRPMLSDSDQTLSSGMLRIPAFPITYLLRRDRTIARIIVGARDWANSEMVKEIEGLLAVRRIAVT